MKELCGDPTIGPHPQSLDLRSKMEIEEPKITLLKALEAEQPGREGKSAVLRPP